MCAQERLRIAILGGGDIARKGYFPLLKGWPGVDVVSLFSRTMKTVNDVNERWQFGSGTNDLDALLDQQPDAAFVLTSTDSHYALVRALLEADVDVYVEKPATESSAETRELAELASARERVLMVGFNRRYAPLYRQAKEIFGSRTIRQCIVEKHRPGTKVRDLAQTYLDDAIHQIDLLRYFGGEAQAVATTYQMDEGRLRSAASTTTLSGGGIGLILMSREAGMWQEKVTLHGGDLTVEVSAFRQLRVKHERHEEVYGADRAGRWMPQLEERGFKGEIEHFFDCVRRRATPETSGRDSVRTQELMEALVDRARATP